MSVLHVCINDHLIFQLKENEKFTVSHKEKKDFLEPTDGSITVKENADAAVEVALEKGKVGGSKKNQNRDYCVTKSTLLSEMKTMAKYDRKVLEMGSKAFMSFLKVLLLLFFFSILPLLLFLFLTLLLF